MYVPYKLYFAKDSSSWGGDVAFLTCEKEPNPEYHTVVRLWKLPKSSLNAYTSKKEKVGIMKF